MKTNVYPTRSLAQRAGAVIAVLLALSIGTTQAQDEPSAIHLMHKNQEVAVELPEQMPEFPGGFIKLLEDLEANLKSPLKGQPVHNAGCWMVRFTVGTDGLARAASVEPSPSNKLSANSPEGKAASQCLWQAMREVIPAPWKPGTTAGKPVAVNIVLPVVLR